LSTGSLAATWAGHYVSSKSSRPAKGYTTRKSELTRRRFPANFRDDEFKLDYPRDASSSFIFQAELSRIMGRILDFFYLSQIKELQSDAKEQGGSKDVAFLKEVSET